MGNGYGAEKRRFGARGRGGEGIEGRFTRMGNAVRDDRGAFHGNWEAKF